MPAACFAAPFLAGPVLLRTVLAGTAGSGAAAYAAAFLAGGFPADFLVGTTLPGAAFAADFLVAARPSTAFTGDDGLSDLGGAAFLVAVDAVTVERLAADAATVGRGGAAETRDLDTVRGVFGDTNNLS